MPMKFSIIVPVYNAENYLRECLDSISKQTYPEFEAILIDDGSTDRSLEICNEFCEKDSRFKAVSVPNGGVSSARNIGIDKAQGDYICFIDSDDYVHERYLEDFSEHILGNDIVVSDYTRRDGLGTKEPSEVKGLFPYMREIVYEQIKHPNIVSFCINRSIIENHNIRFTQGCIIGEDYEFYMKCLSECSTNVTITNFVSYYYRDNPTSAMNKRLDWKSFSTIEASRRVDYVLASKEIIDNCVIASSSEILTLAFFISHQKNKSLYKLLHNEYSVMDAMKVMIHFPVLKKKLVAFVYLLLGKKLFYYIIP